MWLLERVLIFLASIPFDFVFFSVPVLIYRFWIRKGKPVESKWKATWVGWIFWICSFTAFCLLYAILGYYNEDGFSVRPGLLEIAFMALGSFILYYRKKESKKPSPPKHDTHRIMQENVCKCSKCGSPVQKNAKFCTECGNPVSSLISSEMIICPICGAKVRKSKYCAECGHQFVISNFSSASNDPQEDHQDIQHIDDIPTAEPEASVSDPDLSITNKIILILGLLVFIWIFVLLLVSAILDNFVF